VAVGEAGSVPRYNFRMLTRPQKLLSALGALVFIALVAVAFQGYFTPAMLVDFVVRICS